MKRYLIGSYILIVSLFLISCEADNSDPDADQDKDSIPEIRPDPEFFFRIGNSLYYRYSDLELYDSSAHILYFKTSHPEFEENSQSVFSVIINSDTIYKGDFWPMFRSDLPTRVYIHTWPFWLQNYALWIENRYNIKPDLRNDPKIIQSFKDRNLLHSGINLVINSLELTDSQATFSFTITNKGHSALLIMDPDKMGINLFHYYTNGLLFRKTSDGSSFYVSVPAQAPSHYTVWNIDWLTKLNSNESRTFNLVYPLNSPLASGEYKVTFVYPGFNLQISKDQLIQDDARIWLGDVRASVRISI